MADDTVKKTLVYGVEADFKSLGQGVKELIGVLKTVDQSFKTMGKELAESLKLARKGINELEKPMQEMGKGFQAGFKAISQELKLVSKDMQAMRQEFKNALGYVQGESQKTGRAINQLAQQTVQMGKSVQQANKVSSESMRSFAAENKKTQESLRGLANEAKNFKDHAQSAGQALQTLGLMAGAMGAGLSAGIGGAAKEFGDFEAQIIKFGAVSGATSQEIAAIEEQAMKLGASTKFTAQEIGAAQVELAKMGFSAAETTSAMGAMVEASIASGESLAETSTIVATTLRMFNMQASEAGTVSDIITRGANISAQSFDSFANSIRYVGSAAAASNQELVDISGLLAILADRGIKGTVAGNGLQNALLRLQAPTKAAREAMEALNLSIADTKGTADTADDTLRPMLDIIKDIKKTFAERGTNTIAQADYLKDLFGEVALNSMQVFMNTSNEVMDAVMAKQADYLGSTKETADKMRQGQNQAIEEMKSAINGLQIAIGKELAPTIIALAKGVEALVNSFSSLPKPILSAISHIGLLAAAVTTAFAGAAGINFVVGTGTKAFKDFGAAVAASPAGPGAKKIGADVAASFATVNGAVKGSKFYAYLGMAGNTFKSFLNAFKPFIGKILFGMGEIALVAGAVHTAWKTNFGGLKDITRNFTDFLVGENNEALTQWKSEWDSMWSGAGQTFNGVWTGMVDTLISFLGFMDETTTAFFSMIDHISKAARAAADRDWDWFKAEALNAKTEAQTILNNIFNPNSLAQNEARLNAMRERARKKFFGASKQEAAAPKDVAKVPSPSGNTGSSLGDGGGESRISKAIDGIMDELDKSVKTIRDRATQRDTAITNAEAASPGGSVSLPAGDVNRYPLTSRYSRSRINPVTGKATPHTGNDYGAPMGAPIRADFDGTVVFSGSAGGYGNTIVVSDGKGNYAVYAHASKLYKKIDASVKRGETIAAVGSTGNSTGSHLHREHRTSANANLRGAAVFSATPQDPNKTGIFGRGGAVTVDEHDHGADSAQQRMLNEKQAIEQEYAKQAAALARLKALRAQYSTDISKYSKEDQEALKELDKAIGEVKSEMIQLENSAAQKKLDLSKAKAKAEQDEIKAQLKDAADQYGDLGEAGEKALSGLAEKAEELKKANEAAFKSDEQLAEEANQELISAANAAQATLKQQLAGIDAVLAKFKGKTLDEDNKKLVQGLEQRRAEIAASLEASAADLVAFNEQVAESARLDSLADMAAEVAEVFAESDEAFKKLLESEDELRKFAYNIDLGSDSLESMASRLMLSAEQTDQLRLALLKLNNQDATAKFGKELVQTMDEAAKGLGKFMGQIEAVASGVSGAIRDISGFFQSFSKEAESNFSIVAEGLSQFAGGIASIASGIASSNPFAIISGSVQSMNGFLDAGVRLMARMKNEMIGLYRAQTEGAVIDAQNTAQTARERVASLRANGGSAFDIFNAANEATQADLEAQRQALMFDFRKQYGRDRVLDKDAQGNDDIAATIARYERDMLNPKLSNQQKTNLQNIVNYMNTMMRSLNQAASQAQQEFTNNLKEFTEKGKESVDSLQDYLKKETAESALASEADQLVKQFSNGNPELEANLKPIAEKAVQDRAAIIQDVWQAYGTDFLSFSIELSRRLALWGQQAGQQLGEAVVEGQQKAIEKAKQDYDKALAEAQAQLKSDVEAEKKRQKQLFDNETAGLRESLKLDQERLDRMERQTDQIRRQIELKNEDRQKDLDAFNAADKAAFTQMKAAVNYEAEIRSALDAIHNPDGVMTGTYSTESLREAAKEQIDLLKLRNQNAFDEEDKSKKDYLKRIEEIAALEARFAQEALTAENLTTREQVELERIKAQAYKDFQQARIDSINAGYDAEVAVLEKRISDNNRQSQSYRDSIDANNLKLEEFNTKYEANIQALDDGMNALITTQDNIGASLGALADGIDEPMAKITDKYQSLERRINSAYQAALKLNAATGTTYKPYSSTPVNSNGTATWSVKQPSGSGLVPVTKMATGGRVPDGFPNDTFPAWLSSGETVIPQSLSSDLLAHLNRIASLPPVSMSQGGNSYNTPVNVHIYDANDTEAVKRAVIGALKEAGVNPNTAAINGGYYGSLGLN